MIEIRDTVHAFLVAQNPGAGFGDHDDLVATGIVQSIELIELIDFVAGRFGVEVDADDVYRGGFATLAAIVQLIEEKRRP